MGISKNTFITTKQLTDWQTHKDMGCKIGSDVSWDGEGMIFCETHQLMLTNYPEFEPDPYDNSEENLGYASTKDAEGL